MSKEEVQAPESVSHKAGSAEPATVTAVEEKQHKPVEEPTASKPPQGAEPVEKEQVVTAVEPNDADSSPVASVAEEPLSKPDSNPKAAQVEQKAPVGVKPQSLPVADKPSTPVLPGSDRNPTAMNPLDAALFGPSALTVGCLPPETPRDATDTPSVGTVVRQVLEPQVYCRRPEPKPNVLGQVTSAVSVNGDVDLASKTVRAGFMSVTLPL